MTENGDIFHKMSEAAGGGEETRKTPAEGQGLGEVQPEQPGFKTKVRSAVDSVKNKLRRPTDDVSLISPDWVPEDETRPEGENWNIPLQEAGPSIIQQLKDKLPNLNIPPDKKELLEREWGEFKKTLRPKDWREIGALAARIGADFSPELGLAMMTANLGFTVGKEIHTFGKTRTDVKEASPDISFRERMSQTFSEYFNQTTLGKVVSEDSPTGLSKEARMQAAALGTITSVGFISASEAATYVVRAPGVRGITRATMLRAASQYFAPRLANFLAEKVLEKKGLIKSPEQKQEWIDLALKSTGLTTTAYASLMTGIAIHSAGIDLSKAEENVRGAVKSVKEYVEDLPPTREALETIEEEIIEKGPAGVVTGMTEVLKDEDQLATKPAVEKTISTSATTTPEQPPSVETPNLQEIPSREGFDINADGKDDSFIERNTTTGEPIKAILSNDRELLLDAESKGIPGIQLKLLRLHHWGWSPEEVAKAAQLAASEGITADDMDAIVNIEKPEMPAVLGKVDQDITLYQNSDWEYDHQGRIVGGTTSEGEHLTFATQGEGVQHLQYQIANTDQRLTQDQVAKMAQIAFEDGVDPNDLGAVDKFVQSTDLSQFEKPQLGEAVSTIGFDTDNDGVNEQEWLIDEKGHVVGGVLPDGHELFFDPDPEHDNIPHKQFVLANEHKDDWSPEKVARAAFLAHQKGVDLNDTNAVEELVGSSKPENIQLENGHLRMEDLIMGEEGGPTGVVQEYVHQQNSKLSADEVASISYRAVVENDLVLPEKTEEGVNFEQMVGEKQPEVIEAINRDLARYSLQGYLTQSLGLDPHFAHNLAFRRIIFYPLKHDKISGFPPSESALDALNVRVEINGGMYFWKNAPWNQWLKSQGRQN